MAKKKASKKASKKAAETSPTGDTPVAGRILKAGTVVVGAADRRPGSNFPKTLEGNRVPMRLLADTPVEFDGSDRDEVFVSILATNAENFALNIGSVPGTWSPTGVRLPNECEDCGAVIPADAENQKKCAACEAKAASPSKAKAAASFAGLERRVVKDRRVQDVPLNQAPERRVATTDRRKPAVPKKAAKRASKKKAAKKKAPKAE